MNNVRLKRVAADFKDDVKHRMPKPAAMDFGSRECTLPIWCPMTRPG